mmetsp:Transcript_2175/g.3567  ORF Transcript_2175/g.3567 Transcript_2175/m.3567 type:complete len:805 (-) Transcript_2175:182-2596(-)
MLSQENVASENFFSNWQRFEVSLDTFNSIFDLSVKLLQAFNVLFAGIPVSTSVGFQECCHHVAEGIWVGVKQPLLHFWVVDEGIVGIFENKVVNFTSSGRPTHGVAQSFLNLTDTLVSGTQHTLVELGVQKLGTSIQANGFRKSTHLGIRGSSIGHKGHWLLLVVAKTLDNLGRIGIVVVRHISDGDFRRIQVLECDIDSLEGRLEQIGLLFHHTGLVGIESESFSCQELILKLSFVLPSAVFDSETNVGTVRSSRVGENTGGGLTNRYAQLFRLLNGVLSDKVHVQRFVGFGSHLDTTIHQVHLVDEQVTEDTRTGDNNIDARTAKLFQRNEFDLVHTSQRVGNWSDTNQGQHLSKRFSVGLNVVSSPQSEGNAFGVLSTVFIHELFQQLASDVLGNFNSSLGRNGRRIQSMHVASGRKDIRVTDRVTARSRHQELTVQELHDTTQFVVGNNLLQAKFQVFHDTLQTLFLYVGETSIDDSLCVWLLSSGHLVEHVAQIVEDRCDFLHTTAGVRRLLYKRTHSGTGRFYNLGVQIDIVQNTVVVATVDVVDVTSYRRSNHTRKALDVVFRTIQLSNVDQSSNSFFGGRWDTHRVETTWEKTRLDLHNLSVDLADNIVTVFGSVAGSIVGLQVGKVDILIEIAGVSSGNNRVDNGRSTSFVITKTTVRLDQFFQFLETLVQACVFGGRSQVGNSGRVGTSLGNGGLRRIVGGIQVRTWQGVDQTIGVASARHTDLLSRHELQTSMGTKVQDGISLENLFEVSVVGCETVMRARRLGKEQSHGISFVSERWLDTNKDISELLSVDD